MKNKDNDYCSYIVNDKNEKRSYRGALNNGKLPEISVSKVKESIFNKINIQLIVYFFVLVSTSSILRFA